MAREFTIFKGLANEKVVETKVRLELGPTEAVIKQTHSGVCSTDVHILDRGSALGHEGVGIVEALGPYTYLISDIKVGDKVGYGWNQKYCGKCRPCRAGYDSICANVKELWAPDNETGSFGTGGIWDVSGLHKIPDELESKHAAPLMCAGATVWGAMQRGKIMSHHRVGVVGVGGLGHLAIQFLAKSGCEVVVISSSDRKKGEAFELGATEFRVVKDVEKFKEKPFQPLDYLMICTGAQPDYDLYMPIMTMGGTILPLTVDFASTPIPLASTIFGGVNIIGVKICNRYEYDDMFKFCVRHGVKPIVEEYPMSASGLNEAIEALQSGKVHYRAVAVV